MAYYLGLTGGIAGGKSTVAEFFKEKQITVIDADQIAHQLMQRDQKNWQLIIDHFGKDFLDSNYEIDRTKLGNLVFNNSEKLDELNRLVGPTIKAEIKRQMTKHQNETFVVVDIPLLFEGHYEDFVDSILVVYVDEQTQLKRLMSRNNLDKKTAKAKIISQISLAKKKSLADYFIDNTGTIEETKKEFNQLFNQHFVDIWRN